MKIIKNSIHKFLHFSLKIKLLFVFLFIFILFAVFTLFGNKDNTSLKTVVVTKGNVTQIIDETGTLTLTSQTPIYSPSTGIIQELYVKNNDIVGIGQKLFKVQSTATEDQKAAAQSAYLSALSTLKTAQQTKQTLQTQLEQARQAILDARIAYDTMTSDIGSSYTTLQKDSINSAITSAYYNFNTAEKKYIESDVAIAAANATLRSAKLSFESTKDRIINSPTIGTITNISVSRGDTVLSATPDTAIGLNKTIPAVLTIANLSSNSVIVKLNESDIIHVQEGQKVKVIPDAFLDVVYRGVISRVDTIGVKEQGVVTYTVYINLINADEKLKPGMTVDVSIITKSVKNVLVLPNSAIKPYKGGRAVRVYDKKKKKIVYKPVVVGLRGPQNSQIIKGVYEKEHIISTVTNEQLKQGLMGF